MFVLSIASLFCLCSARFFLLNRWIEILNQANRIESLILQIVRRVAHRAHKENEMKLYRKSRIQDDATLGLEVQGVYICKLLAEKWVPCLSKLVEEDSTSDQ